MKAHGQWLRDVRNMNWSVAAHSGAMAPVWTIHYAGEAYRTGAISLEEKEKAIAEARRTMGME